MWAESSGLGVLDFGGWSLGCRVENIGSGVSEQSRRGLTASSSSSPWVGLPEWALFPRSVAADPAACGHGLDFRVEG